MADIENYTPTSRSSLELGTRTTLSHRRNFEETDELFDYLNNLMENFEAIALTTWGCSFTDNLNSLSVFSWTDLLPSQNNLIFSLSPTPIPAPHERISSPRSAIVARRFRIQLEQVVVLLNLVLSTVLGVGIGILTSRLDTGFSVGTATLAVLSLAQRLGFAHSRRID